MENCVVEQPSTSHEISCRLKRDEEFDPHEYGKNNGIGYWGAALHLFRYSVGSGILLMPYIVMKSGYIMGALSIALTSIVYFHIVHTTVSLEYKMCKRLKLERLNYVELVSKVIETAPLSFINKFSHPIRLGMFCYYGIPTNNITNLIVMADGIQAIAKFYDIKLKTTAIISVVIIPLTACCMHRKILKILVPFSLITNIFTFIMAAVIAGYSVLDRREPVKLQTFGDDLTFVPKSVVMYMHVFGIGIIILSVKNNMKEPKKFSTPFGSMSVAFLATVVFHYVFGLVCYVNYGQRIPENILLNLPENSFTANAVNLLNALSLSMSYVLIFFARFDNIWTNNIVNDQVNENPHCMFLLEYSIRILLNVITYLVAVLIPDLAIVSIFSGVMSLCVNVLLPPILELIYLLTERKGNWWIVFKNSCVIGMCAVLLVTDVEGFITQVKNLYLK